MLFVSLVAIVIAIGVVCSKEQNSSWGA